MKSVIAWLLLAFVLMACGLTTQPTLVFPTRQPTLMSTAENPFEPTPDPGQPAGKIVFVCQQDKVHNQICIMNADGSGQRILVPWPSVQSYYPSFAPDGQSVIFASNRNGEFALYEAYLTGDAHLIPTVEREVASPAISPDGQWIVFTIVGGVDDNVIALTSRLGGEVTILYDHDGWDPVWSPDGSRILFAGSTGGRVELFIMDRDGSHVQQVTALDGLRGRNDWSPQGDQLSTYIGEAALHDRNIYTFGLAGENLRMITSGGDNLAPSYSPDGEWITFMSYRDHFWDTFGCEIYIMRVDGSNVRRLTFNDTCDWQPRWGR